MAYRKFYRRRPRKYIRRRRYTGKRKVPKVIRRYVRKTVARNIENKRNVIYGYNQTVTGVTINNPPSMNLFALPVISQGVAEGQRLGDRIKLKNCHVHLDICHAPYDATANPHSGCYVTVLFLKARNSNAGVIPANNWVNLFDAGTSTVTWQQNTMDTLFQFNENIFNVVYKRIFNIGHTKSNDYGQSPTTFVLPGNEAVQNVRTNFRLPLKKIRKMIRYDDNTSIPQSENLWMYAYASPYEYNGTYDVNKTPARISYVLQWEFEDA